MVSIENDPRLEPMAGYLWEHAQVHSAAVATLPGVPGLEDLIARGLSDDQLRARPAADLNSIAWLLWHMARCEDVAMNAILTGERQVLDEDGWRERLTVGRGDIGTRWTPAEVDDFNARIDVAALRAYRAAVGRRTREVILTLQPAMLAEPVSEARLSAAYAAGALGENASWVRQFWQGKSGQFFLWLGTGHNYLHLGEAMCLRSQAGVGLGL